MTYDLHPLCTLFPRMVSTEFKALVSDIKEHGLREPIVLHDGLILDGGNRYRACVQAGVDPAFTTFANGNPVSFVLSANLHRRHMTAGQQAAIVASAQDWANAQAVGRPNKSGNVTGLPDYGLDTVAKRAAQSGASDKTQRQADKVAKADPELAAQVAHGEVSLPEAVAKVDGKPAKTSKPKVITEDRAAEILAENESLHEANAELAKTAAEAVAENDSMGAIFDSDDKLAAATKEITKLRAQIRTLTERNNGLMGENSELKRLLKAAQRKLEKVAA